MVLDQTITSYLPPSLSNPASISLQLFSSSLVLPSLSLSLPSFPPFFPSLSHSLPPFFPSLSLSLFTRCVTVFRLIDSTSWA